MTSALATLPPRGDTAREEDARDDQQREPLDALLLRVDDQRPALAVDDDGQKYLTLKDLYQVISMSSCIIYCNSVKRVVDLYEAMSTDNFPVTCIHSNMTKQERVIADIMKDMAEKRKRK